MNHCEWKRLQQLPSKDIRIQLEGTHIYIERAPGILKVPISNTSYTAKSTDRLDEGI